MNRETVIGLMLAAMIFVGGFTTAVRTAEDLRESCESVNVLRQQVNDRAEPIRRTLLVLIEARRPNGSIGINDHRAAEAARVEAAELQRQYELITTLELTDCNEAVRSPWPLSSAWERLGGVLRAF